MIEKIKNYLNKIISVMALPIGVTFVVLFVFYIVFQTYIVFNISHINPELLNASIAMVLVFVTILYVSATWQIVDESKKSREITYQIVEETRNDRKIAYIEKRLEKLYYPMKLFLNPTRHIPFPPKLIKDYNDFSKSSMFYKIEKIEDIIPFLYLASDNSKEYFERYIEMYRDEKLSNSEEMQVLKIKIIEMIEQDIADFRNKLAKLIT